MLTRRLAALAASAALAPFLLTACGGDEPDTTADDPATSAPAGDEPTETAEAAGTCEYAESGEAARDVTPPPAEPTVSGDVEITFVTSVGDIDATLDAASAPCTVGSFVSLAEQDFYDDTPCPRLGNQPGFGILQCGDPTGTGAGGPGYTFADELTGDETYPGGTLAMANAGPDTNGSQFFFVFADSQFPPSYTVFGEVSEEGLAILEEVAAKGDDGSHPAGGGAPNQKVQIEDVVVG